MTQTHPLLCATGSAARLAAAVLCTLLAPHVNSASARPQGPDAPAVCSDSLTRNIVAVHVNPHAPAIDGRLDDECWHKARPVSGFLQHEPDEGQPSRQMTTVLVMYDDAALYVG